MRLNRRTDAGPPGIQKHEVHVYQVYLAGRAVLNNLVWAYLDISNLLIFIEEGVQGPFRLKVLETPERKALCRSVGTDI